MEAVLEPPFSPSCSLDGNENGINATTGEAPEREVSPAEDKSPVDILPDSVSTEDQRLLDMEGRQDGSSPRGVPEDNTRSAESETGSPKESTSDIDAQALAKVAFHWNGFFRLLKCPKMRQIYTFHPVGVPKFSKWKGKHTREASVPNLNPAEDTELYPFKSSWKNFTLSEIESATNNFSSENVLGKGGYGEVYKGQLPDGQHVAIKRLARGTPEEKIADFLSELGIIVHVDHPNTAKLIGYGVEGGMHLVLQLSPNGNLSSILHDTKQKLKWSIRYKIAKGTAEGLQYLHENCPRRIIHRDIKSANVLLTEDFEAQICDFGLAKWLPEQWTHHTVPIEGTFGYIAPEYFMYGIVDEKTDVYAYGVLLLELITGRKALDNSNESNQSLVMWAKPFLDVNAIEELVDPSLDEYDAEQMNHLVLLATSCTQDSSYLRPRMSQVVQILKGEECSLECAKQSQHPCLQRSYSMQVVDAKE
ncbi:PREDICTED: receptor-like cytosolic serine/threonine-protein kinase RBK2 [Nelumbo nucifera]|uniref:non-specific serine/threonine protein kinase n=2 Tax=Nelumbo nucifera TaxID=4432 RepID=A0A822YPJ9_NELNU|nr:PREDICTED: receptor-like cytosolic serine/threonine-protein kinase RBK2 [Nelumbo nucifera]DAD33511.1 TPA_asm: hypothetical protein HUJ06_012362 [Nelumbo nucifera]